MAKPFCAFYTEVAERDQWEAVEQFMTEFSSGISATDLQESSRSGNANQRKLEARYSRLGQTLGIEVDLVTGELMRRFTEQGDMDLSEMTSSIALHSDSSPVIIDEARLDLEPEMPGCSRYRSKSSGSLEFKATSQLTLL